MSTNSRHHDTILLRGGDPKKKFSDGLKATLRAISRYWARPFGAEKRAILVTSRLTREVFREEFEPIYREIEGHYGGVSPNKNLTRTIKEINQGSTELPFFVMRAYAEYVGLPTGLLLLFSNVMSDITQDDAPERVLNLLESSKVSIEALIRFLENAHESGGDLRNSLFEDNGQDELGRRRYNARLEGLEKMSTAFNSGRLTRKGASK
jgi:hypothetical protein